MPTALAVILQMLKARNALLMASLPDAQIIQEANRLLMEHFSPAKLVRLWAVWHTGGGDYLAWREETFGEHTVAQLYDEILAYQAGGDTVA